MCVHITSRIRLIAILVAANSKAIFHTHTQYEAGWVLSLCSAAVVVRLLWAAD